jgi:thymidylate synthase (FAD)
MQVYLIAATSLDGEWFKVFRDVVGMSVGDGRQAEELIEFAGRNCYQSWNNPGGKTNKEYIQTLLAHGHGSVLEHASATFFITGVSRSLTHELIRHRHLSFSELSQRFVNVEDAEFVCPPAFEERPELIERLMSSTTDCVNDYTSLVERLQEEGLPRKQAREAARCVMPNCTETKIVVTGNFRAWRGVIEARGSEHADAEIRRLAVEICRQLSDRFPAVFGDMVVYQMEDGEWAVKNDWREV